MKNEKLLRKVAGRLKKVRAALGLTQEKLIETMKNTGGFSVKSGTLSNYERGETAISFEFLEALGRCFDNVSIDYIIRDKGPVLKRSRKNGNEEKRSVEEIWSELEEGIKGEEFVYDMPVDFPTFSEKELNDPETIKTMLRYFVNNKEVRAGILQHFSVMLKPGIDRKNHKN